MIRGVHGSKIEAMKRVADETDRLGFANFPRFMLGNMRQWEREGLVTLENHGTAAKITAAGRKLAKKSLSPITKVQS